MNETNFGDTNDCVELVDYNFRRSFGETYRCSNTNIFDSLCKYGDVKQAKKDSK